MEKLKKYPPDVSFCGDTEWEKMNRKSIGCISTLLKANQIYKGNSKKYKGKGKMMKKCIFVLSNPFFRTFGVINHKSDVLTLLLTPILA